MPTSEEIKQQQELLRKHRETLAILLSQHATHTGAYAPPSVVHGIREARAAIAQYKATLRGWGVPVEDLPDDEVPKKISTIPQGSNYKERFSELKEWKIVHQNTQKLLLNMYPLEAIATAIEIEITNTIINQIRDTWFAFCEADAKRIVSEFHFNLISQDKISRLLSILNQEPGFSERIRLLSTENIDDGLSLKWSIKNLRRQLEEVLNIADIFIVRIVEDLEREV